MVKLEALVLAWKGSGFRQCGNSFRQQRLQWGLQGVCFVKFIILRSTLLACDDGQLVAESRAKLTHDPAC